MFIQLVISGLVLGGIYAMVALGYSLIYKASGLMSFVQGDLLTLGAFLGLTYYNIFKFPFGVSLT
jgi:branched-chain amino acid transport system permease protein